MEIAIVVFWITCGIGASFVASSRGGSSGAWFTIGLFLGPIGLAMAFAASPERKCGFCRLGVFDDATRCPHCQSDISPVKDQSPIEALPAGAPAEQQVTTTPKLVKVALAALAIAATGGVIYVAATARPQPAAATHIRNDTFCVPSAEDASRMLEVDRHAPNSKASDDAQVQKRINRVYHDTSAEVMSTSLGIANVRLTSGYRSGETCWMPADQLEQVR